MGLSYKPVPNQQDVWHSIYERNKTKPWFIPWFYTMVLYHDGLYSDNLPDGHLKIPEMSKAQTKVPT